MAEWIELMLCVGTVAKVLVSVIGSSPGPDQDNASLMNMFMILTFPIPTFFLF